MLLRFSLPVIGGNLFQLFYTLADSVIVGKTLGSDALAAVGATSIIIYLVLCFIQGITGGFGICLGQRCGAGDEAGMRRSIAASLVWGVVFTVVLTGVCCGLAHPILHWMQTPEEIYGMAYDYMFAILAGTGATIFYNMISNILRALGDSRTPLYFLVFSSLLNIVLDLVFILTFHMGVGGAAWATVLSQLISAVLCTVSGARKYPVLHLKKDDFSGMRRESSIHLRIGFPMGFQMSVMCIGQLAMQAAVNAIGPDAIAGYTAATKVDQLSVLINNAFGVAIAGYVAQNYGAGRWDRIRNGVKASLIQTEVVNILLGILIIGGRSLVVPMFIDTPTDSIIHYANGYLLAVAPFFRAEYGKRRRALCCLYHGTDPENSGDFRSVRADGVYRDLPGKSSCLAGRRYPAGHCVRFHDEETKNFIKIICPDRELSVSLIRADDFYDLFNNMMKKLGGFGVRRFIVDFLAASPADDQPGCFQLP